MRQDPTHRIPPSRMLMMATLLLVTLVSLLVT